LLSSEDWIKNDNEVSDVLETVDQYVNGNENLRFCGDLANRTMHLISVY
jgi:hypothetical protein